MSKAIKKTKKTINQSTLRTKATRVLNQVREIDYNMPYKLMHIQQTIEDLNKRKFESTDQLKD